MGDGYSSPTLSLPQLSSCMSGDVALTWLVLLTHVALIVKPFCFPALVEETKVVGRQSRERLKRLLDQISLEVMPRYICLP